MAMTEMKNQSVIVAGASGVFGRHIREALTDAGHTVLVRQPPFGIMAGVRG